MDLLRLPSPPATTQPWFLFRVSSARSPSERLRVANELVVQHYAGSVGYDFGVLVTYRRFC
jgi:hypothetical protein